MILWNVHQELSKLQSMEINAIATGLSSSLLCLHPSDNEEWYTAESQVILPNQLSLLIRAFTCTTKTVSEADIL